MSVAPVRAARESFIHVLDHLFFLRPLLLAPATAMFIMGRRAAADWSLSSIAAGSPALVPDARPILAFAALVCALLAAHVANQLADRESDRANGKLPHLAAGLVTPRASWILMIASLLSAIVLSGFLDTAIRPLVAASILLGLAYSAPPLALKRRAGWDLVANAVGYGGIAFAIGWGTSAPLASAPLATAAVPWVLAVGAVFAATTVVDEPGDRSAGARTLAVAIGPPRTRAVACGLLLLSMASSAVMHATVPLALAAASLPLMLIAWRRPSRRSDHLAFQVAAGLPALAAAWHAPLFGAALVAVALATRAYYRARFGWGYPHLGAPERAQGFGLRTTLEDSPGSTR